MAIVVTSEACDCADTSQRRSGRIEPLKKSQFIECADVAQLAEQLICNQQVNGSSPFIGFRSEMAANAKSICKQKKAVRKQGFLTLLLLFEKQKESSSKTSFSHCHLLRKCRPYH